MTYNVTVQSVAYLASHQMDEQGKMLDAMKHQAYYAGDVVDVYALIKDAPNPIGRLAFAHVTGVPDSVPFDELREVLTTIFSYEDLPASQRLKRLWKLDLSALTMDHLLGIRGERVMHTDWKTFASSYWYFDLSKQLINQWP